MSGWLLELIRSAGTNLPSNNNRVTVSNSEIMASSNNLILVDRLISSRIRIEATTKEAEVLDVVEPSVSGIS